MGKDVGVALVKGLLAGDRRALGRAITLVENHDPLGRAIMGQIYTQSTGAPVVGITGAPGVGKSTLVSALTAAYRAADQRVGILAVDPSSPFTGGALLGDRIRMATPQRDDGVFFRSVATRGRVGGLSRATAAILRLLAAAHYPTILLETVGAGQSEVEVMGLAHTVLVVLAPGLGDEIQALKAGILEIGDIFIVNKADRAGAERTVAELKAMLSLGDRGRWRPPVLKTVASDGEGIDAVVAAVARHQQLIKDDPRLVTRRRRLAEQQLWEEAAEQLVAALLQGSAVQNLWTAAVADVAAGRRDPGAAIEDLLTATGLFAGVADGYRTILEKEGHGK